MAMRSTLHKSISTNLVREIARAVDIAYPVSRFIYYQRRHTRAIQARERHCTHLVMAFLFTVRRSNPNHVHERPSQYIRASKVAVIPLGLIDITRSRDS